MTQTVRIASGRQAVDIYADRGMGRKTYCRTVSWRRVGLEEYLERVDLEGLDDQQAKAHKATLSLFARGYAFEACEYDGSISEFFKTEKEARAWAWSRDC